MRIAIATDCWFPQINGIARTLDATAREIVAMGHEVRLLTPDDFPHVPLPRYTDDRIVFAWYPKLARLMREFSPDYVHIATQGLLGLSARIWCWRNAKPFQTSFHTRFPEYAAIRLGLPKGLMYAYFRRFHGSTAPVLVPSQSLADELARHGFRNLRLWRRGVNTDLYRPRRKAWTHYPRPIHLYVGRIAEEKNVEAFLRAPVDGTKLVVGDGPQLAALRSAYPGAVFAGARHGEKLAEFYAEADVLVFPSLLDTFGLVVLEALASGVPVAAFPVPHLVETFGADGVVTLDDDLARACRRARAIAPEDCRAVAMQFSWEACTRQFMRTFEDLEMARAGLSSPIAQPMGAAAN
jgi:glycosyltransferase involved in cell wall biosynthesis